MSDKLLIPHQKVKFTTDPKTYDVTVDLEDSGEVSDSYHTFDELYEFRMLYNAALFNEWALQHKYKVYKSRVHKDGLPCFGGGWFVVAAELPTGQISNHYEDKYWNFFKVPHLKPQYLPEFDGHTAQDVATRLRDYLERAS